MTIAVLAHPRDASAARLVQAWQAHGARLLLPRDLSRPGWRMYVGGRGEEWFVAGEERLRVASLRGVLARLPAIEARDLDHLHEGDRDYAAAEMGAFLTAWLTALRCPVLNRPSASQLLGPQVGADHLPGLAARAGLSMCTRLPLREQVCTVSVVGTRCIGTPPAALARQALRIADAAGASLLTLQFDSAADDAALVSAEPLVDIDDPAIAQAVLDCFGPGGAA
jgi:hypothetical protein